MYSGLFPSDLRPSHRSNYSNLAYDPSEDALAAVKAVYREGEDERELLHKVDDPEFKNWRLRVDDDSSNSNSKMPWENSDPGFDGWEIRKNNEGTRSAENAWLKNNKNIREMQRELRLQSFIEGAGNLVSDSIGSGKVPSINGDETPLFMNTYADETPKDSPLSRPQYEIDAMRIIGQSEEKHKENLKEWEKLKNGQGPRCNPQGWNQFNPLNLMLCVNEKTSLPPEFTIGDRKISDIAADGGLLGDETAARMYATGKSSTALKALFASSWLSQEQKKNMWNEYQKEMFTRKYLAANYPKEYGRGKRLGTEINGAYRGLTDGALWGHSADFEVAPSYYYDLAVGSKDGKVNNFAYANQQHDKNLQRALDNLDDIQKNSYLYGPAKSIGAALTGAGLAKKIGWIPTTLSAAAFSRH